MDSASEIIRTIQQISVPTYTFVEKSAFSAGAIIAMATKHIYMAPGSVIGDAMPIMMTPMGGVQEMPPDLKEKAVSAVAAMIRSAAETGGHSKELAEKMVRSETEFKIDNEVICPTGRLLTLTNIEAERKIGKNKRNLLSEDTVANVQDLLKQIGLGNAKVVEIEVTTAEKVARFVTQLAPLFLMAGLLGIYIEIKTPGVMLPGLLGAICLAIFFWGHLIAGLAGLEDVVVFLIGVLLLVVEVVFVPSMGFLGIVGLFLMIWGLLDAMVRHYPGGPWYPQWNDLQFPLFKLSLSLVCTAVGAVILARFLPKSKLFNQLVLQSASTHQPGIASGVNTDSLVGQEGVALSFLRPAGSGRFGEQKLDVITRGDYLQSGTPIRIVECHGSRIIVEAIRGGSEDKAVK